MIVGKAKGYGCYNREEFITEYEVPDVVITDGKLKREWVLVTIPFPMTRDCQYTHTELGQKDERCLGCKWRKN